MKTKLLASFYAVAVAAQLWIPASILFSSERSLHSGKAFRFKTAPVDPHDAFRGKYVSLDFEAGEIDPLTIPVHYNNNPGTVSNKKEVYARIAENENGFAEVIELRTDKPPEGYYVKVRVRTSLSGTIRIQFPFSRFFLEEDKAQKAEQTYRRLNRTGERDSYAVVKINQRGRAVIEDLVLGGIPVKEAVKEDALP